MFHHPTRVISSCHIITASITRPCGLHHIPSFHPRPLIITSSHHHDISDMITSSPPSITRSGHIFSSPSIIPPASSRDTSSPLHIPSSHPRLLNEMITSSPPATTRSCHIIPSLSIITPLVITSSHHQLVSPSHSIIPPTSSHHHVITPSIGISSTIPPASLVITSSPPSITIMSRHSLTFHHPMAPGVLS